jgi:hypothetical protein
MPDRFFLIKEFACIRAIFLSGLDEAMFASPLDQLAPVISTIKATAP